MGANHIEDGGTFNRLPNPGWPNTSHGEQFLAYAISFSPKQLKVLVHSSILLDAMLRLPIDLQMRMRVPMM